MSSPDNKNIFLTQARVYIAGVLMPVASVSIQAAFNRPPTASITLPAYPELFPVGDMDRVPVHVFVQETMVESRDFLLMFEGFIVSKGYINSAVQRSITIEAISYFDILNDIQLKLMSQLTDMFEQYADGQKDIALYVTQPGVFFPGYLFRKGLTGEGENGESGKTISTPSDYLENIYKFVDSAGRKEPVEIKFSEDDSMTVQGGGAPIGPGHASVMASFYSQYMRNLKLMDRFERLPYFDGPGEEGAAAWTIAGMEGEEGDKATIFPMIYGMQTHHAINQIASRVNDAMKTRSLMEMLDYLVNEMEYEYAFITNPAFHAAELPLLPADTDDSDMMDQPGTPTPSELDEEEKKPAKLVSTCLKPLLTDTMPPKCNVLHRPLVNNIYTNVVYKNVPTRVQVTDMFGPLNEMISGAASTALAQFGLIDYYPSNKYEEFERRDSEGLYLRTMGSEMLEVERYTGPWVHQVGTPRWFHYVPSMDLANAPDVLDSEGNPIPAAKVFKERFCRRQLLNAKYFSRRLNAATMFNPYVTPGFPGVVFDSADSNFAFAGHIIAVEHRISPTDMSTKISMNFVRMLQEAVTVEIPNPLTAIQNITHDENRLSELYQSILGTPKMKSISGANAVTYADLTQYLESGDPSTYPESHDPQKAYAYQRRNIVTFEEYCGFMGFGIEYGEGPEGPQTPIAMTGTFLEDRRRIKIFTGFTQPEPDPVIPESELIAKADEATEEGENSTGSAEQGQSGEAGQASDQHNTPIDNAEPLVSDKIADAANKRKEEKRRLTEQELSLRDLLFSIARKEFSTMIYR